MRRSQALISGPVLLVAVALLFRPAPAAADTGAVDPRPDLWAVAFDGSHDASTQPLLARHVVGRVTWQPGAPLAAPSRPLALALTQQPDQTATPRPTAFEYSDAYNVRRKIHFYASFATIPLFVTEAILGQKLYDGTGDSGTRSTHGAIAATIAVLFGVNTATGVWNLWESRKDPNKRTKRLVHGILMLAADVGFVATGALAPDDDEGFSESNRSTHRTVAYTSMATAAVSYVIMLIGR